MPSCTINLLVAVQRCPVVPNAPHSTPSRANSRLASSITIWAFFPPSSRETLLRESLAVLEMVLPTAVEPVNEIRFTSGCSTRGTPTRRPPPCTKFTTFGGTPASRRISTKVVAVKGVSDAGLKITGFPHTRAGNIFQVGIAIGKFQGVMMPATPTGVRTDMLNLFGSSDGTVCPNKRRPSLAA